MTHTHTHTLCATASNTQISNLVAATGRAEPFSVIPVHVNAMSPKWQYSLTCVCVSLALHANEQ